MLMLLLLATLLMSISMSHIGRSLPIRRLHGVGGLGLWVLGLLVLGCWCWSCWCGVVGAGVVGAGGVGAGVVGAGVGLGAWRL